MKKLWGSTHIYPSKWWGLIEEERRRKKKICLLFTDS